MSDDEKPPASSDRSGQATVQAGNRQPATGYGLGNV